MSMFEDIDDDRPARRRHRHDPELDDYDDAPGPNGDGYVKPHRGVMILVFGILGLMICQIFGIVALVMGKTDLAEIDAGRMDFDGRALTRTGYVLGLISTIIFAATLSLVIVLAVIG